jgi:NAD(P)-dependent dehydrogenase (short-subunit alcohol dehydrogenase family)
LEGFNREVASKQARVALVTGGSRGIGAALVQAFRAAGWTVATCSRSGAANSDAQLSFACDVSVRTQVEDGVRRVVEQLGRLDAVINNAGIAATNSLEPGAPSADWERILSVNLHGPYYVTHAALPHLPSGSGRIINIGSVLALRGAPDQSAYTAAKHGLLGFTRALALHVAPRGITANIICPGWVKTEMGLARMAALGWSEAELTRSVPAGRWIEPAEVAQLALYLASDAAAGITGQALTIDGGALA